MNYKTIFLLIYSCVMLSLSAQNKALKLLLASVEEGQELPETAWLIQSDGDTTSYRQFKGKWLFANYWTAGCKPCIKGFPKLNELYSKANADTLQIIGIYVGKDIKRWKKARNRYDIQFPDFYGGWSQNNPFLALSFKHIVDQSGNQKIITETPQYVLIDPDGTIVEKSFQSPNSHSFIKALAFYIKD